MFFFLQSMQMVNFMDNAFSFYALIDSFVLYSNIAYALKSLCTLIVKYKNVFRNRP